MLASGDDLTVKCWRLSDNALVHTFKSAGNSRITLSIDGSLVAFRTENNKIELSDLPAGNSITAADGICCALRWDGELLIVATDDGKLGMYRVSDGSYSYPDAACSGCTAIAVSPEGDYIAAAYGEDGKQIRLFDGEGKTVGLPACGHSTESLAFSLERKALICYGGGFFSILSVPDGRELRRGRMTKGVDMGSLLLSPLGKQFLTGGDASFLTKIASKTKALSMAFTPGGEFAITGGKDGSVKFWRLPDIKFHACLMDIACSGAQQQGVTFNCTDEWGQTLTFTLPCGSPLPSGATCVCNCVPGKVETSCTCNRVCTCNRQSICTCNPQRICTCVPVYR
jgi:WD40 repeat protein